MTNSSLCTGCRACELICSARHYGESNPVRSRIRVIQDPKRCLAAPVMCRNCEDPACQKVCIVGAIARDPKTYALIIDEERCTGCKDCVSACKYGGLNVDTKTGKPTMCDLCRGGPQCVAVCAAGALRFVERYKVGTEVRRARRREMVEAVRYRLVAKAIQGQGCT